MSRSQRAGHVVLVVAPAGRSDFLDTTTLLGRMPNIGINYIAGAVDAVGYKVTTIDRHNDEVTPLDLAREIAELKPSLVGFTLYDMTMETTKQTLLFLSLLYDGPVVVGGYTATFHAEEVLNHWPEVDYVIVREGEYAIVSLVRHLDGDLPIEEVPNCVYRQGKDVKHNQEHSLVDVATVPWPLRSWPEASDLTAILSRRGCTNACTFCSMVPFYDRDLGPVVRMRTPTDVVDELAYCYENGATEFMFYDDDFGLITQGEKEWCAEFCDLLAARDLPIAFGMELRIIDVLRGRDYFARLKDVGLTHLQIGMESLLSRQLTLYRKGYRQDGIVEALVHLRSLSIDYQTNVLFWDPSITLPEAAEHLGLLEEIGIADQLGSANFAIFAGTLAMRKGTGLYQQWNERGLLRQREGEEFYRFDYDFQDEQVAEFHGTHLYRFLCETRKGVERPPPLWMVVPRLERSGHRELADSLRAFGRKLAHAELDYFQELLKTALDQPVDQWSTRLGDIHDERAPVVRDLLANIPYATPETLASVGFGRALLAETA